MVRKKTGVVPKVEIRAVCDCPDVDMVAIRQCAKTVMSETGFGQFELSILLADDAYIRMLNRQYRGVDRTTNVLAFPQDANLRRSPVPLVLGDIAISVEKARRDSVAAGHSLSEEMSRLIVHGVLHLAGHDHRTRAQAYRMRELERVVRERTR